MPTFYKQGYGTWGPFTDPATIESYRSRGWTEVADQGSQAGQFDQFNIDPNLPQQKWELDYLLQAGQLGVQQYNAQVSALQAQANAANTAFSNNTSLLGTVANAYTTLARDPKNTFQYADLMYGDPRGGVNPMVARLAGLTGDIAYSPFDVNGLKRMKWKDTGIPGAIDSLYGDSSSGGTGAGYAQALGSGSQGGAAAPSVTVNGQPVGGDGSAVGSWGGPILPAESDAWTLPTGATGPLVPNELGLGGGTGGGYTRAVPLMSTAGSAPARNGARSRDDLLQQGRDYADIGNPNRALQSYGLDPIGPNGEFQRPMWVEGQLREPDGWNDTAYRYPRRNPRTQAEEYQWGQYVESGFDPAKYPSWALAEEPDAAAWQQQRASGQTPKSGASGSGGADQSTPNAAVNAGATTDRTSSEFYNQPAQTGESAKEAQYRQTYGSKASLTAAAESGRGIKGSYDGPGYNGEATTIVIADDGSQREYRDRDGAVITRGAPQAAAQPAPQPGYHEVTEVKGPGTAAGAPSMTIGGQPRSTDSSQAPRQVASVTIGGQSRVLDSAQFGPGATRNASTNTNRESGGGSSGGGSAQFSASGRNLSGGTEKSDQEKAADRARRQEEDRATGGISVVKQPTHFTANGQPFLVGEHGHDEIVARYPNGGGAETVAVYPLQNQQVPVPPLVAQLANALVPGDPYAPTTRSNSLPGYARNVQVIRRAGGGMDQVPPTAPMGSIPSGMGGPASSPMGAATPPMGADAGPSPTSGAPQVLCSPDGPGTFTVTNTATGETLHHVPLHVIQPLIDNGTAQLAGQHGGGDPMAKSPIGLASGGAVSVYGDSTPRVIGAHPDATLWSANKPFNLSDLSLEFQRHYGDSTPKLAKDYNPNTQAQYVSDSGQVQAPGKPGDWSKVSQGEGMPLPNPQMIQQQAFEQLQNDPLAMDMLNSLISAKGAKPTSYWAQFSAALPQQNAPAALPGYARRFG